MGPKISEAKTPPLRKPASLFSLLSPTPTLLSCYLLSPFFKHFFLPHMDAKITALPTSACFEPLWDICISVLSLLSACLKFKHAYGGRMCLWSPCVSLESLSLTLSLPPRQLLFFFILYFSLITSSNPSSYLSISFSISSSVSKPQYYCHTYKCVHAGYASTHEWTHKRICTQTHNRAYINVQTHAHRQYQDTHMHRHWQWQNGSLLHSNTLRICRATLPISGTLLRAVDFWRGKHTVMSTVNWCHNYPPLHLAPSTCVCALWVICRWLLYMKL